jgi:hypothetical protein
VGTTSGVPDLRTTSGVPLIVKSLETATGVSLWALLLECLTSHYVWSAFDREVMRDCYWSLIVGTTSGVPDLRTTSGVPSIVKS